MKMFCGLRRQSEAATALFRGERSIQKRRRASLAGAVQTAILRASTILGVLLCLGSITLAVPPIRIDDPVEGQKLAAELRSMVPTENTEFTGTLRISSPDAEPRDVPIKSTVTVTPANWATRYEARTTSGVEVLIIRHAPKKTNEYEWQRGEQIFKFTGDQATNSFAGSDFALLDLGLEFFNWPTQVLVMKEMRKGRGCRVLESRPASATIYSRVLSWIDEETNGILMAEAYDARGRLLKEFEVKAFKKVAGRWQVREMEIRNRETKTSTRLQFNFEEK